MVIGSYVGKTDTPPARGLLTARRQYDRDYDAFTAAVIAGR